MKFECDCGTYGTKRGDRALGASDASMCCHTRLLKSIFSPDSSPFVNMNKIGEAKLLVNVSVIQLPAGPGVDKFSVTDGETAELVTLSNISLSKRNIVKCHSTNCKLCAVTCRDVDTLRTSKNLCSHLILFRQFYFGQIFEEMGIDPETDIDVDDDVDHETPLLLPDEKVGATVKRRLDSEFNLQSSKGSKGFC